MDVRLARPTDVPLVLALILDEHAHIVRSHDWSATRPTLHSLLRALIPYASSGRLWIAREGDSMAVLEARPRRYVIGWDITRLAVRGDPDRVLGPAIGIATRHLQSRGVPRLFARCREEQRELLEKNGFRSLGREYVLIGRGKGHAEPVSLPVDSRYRMPQDAWPLHQLESRVTPPDVRQLEGLTSLDWAQGLRGMEEIVVEQGGHIVAWLGWGPGTAGFHQIGLLVDPEHRELGADLLDHVLEKVGEQVSFLARVRGYHLETLDTLRRAGFDVVAEEILLVRHAAVIPARSERAQMRIAHVPSIHVFPSNVLPINGGILGTQKEGILPALTTVTLSAAPVAEEHIL